MTVDRSGVKSAERVILNDHEITKSPTDQRSYRIIELDNGMRCVLVHEAQLPQASAAVSIAAGHFHDPHNAQGLAHLLEHMLFLGTERYPDPNSYQKFISAHGGSHNAWTGTEYSNYYFTVDAAHFSAALDRFMRFFYEPLLAPKWIEKELQSIESEFQLKRQDELRRLYQVHKATANPKHPFSNFSVGNLTTLIDRPEATLRQQLRLFFERWYCARRMTCVLLGPQSLDELAALAKQHAAPIKSGCADIWDVDEPLYLPEQLGVEIYMKPLKDARRLIVTFALPGINDDYANKTTSYLAHLLGYEGPHSLYSVLRDKHWINSLAAGGGISGSNFKDFNINMQLTEQGMHHRDDIITEIFSFIQLIREQGIDDWRYQERRVSIMNAFNFQEQPRASDLAPQLAVNLQHYLAEDVIFGDYRMDGLYRPKVEHFLDCMHPSNMRVTVIHKAVPTDRLEPIYGSEYAIRPLTQKQLKRFLSPPPSSAQLPPPNPYLQQPLQVQPYADCPAATTPKRHQILPGLTCWHLYDIEFKQPKAHVYIGLQLPQVIASSSSFALARLWCELKLDRLNEECYDAEIAGLNFNLYPQQQGMTLHITGPAHAVPQLAQTIVAHLQQSEFDQQRWHDLRLRLITNWRQALLHKPLNFLFSQLNVQLQPHTYSVIQLAAELEKFNFRQFCEDSSALFEPAQVQLFVHGDIQLEQINPLVEQLQQWFDLSQKLPEIDLTPSLLTELDKESLVATQHPDHAVIVVLQTWQTDVVKQGLFMLINQLIQPRFFAQLRTEQQLGYLVGTTYLPMQQIPHLLFYVQSSRVDHHHLHAAIEEFFHGIDDVLDEIQPQEFDQVRQSIMRQLTENDTSLRSRSQRYWSAITQHDHEFSRLKRIAVALSNMTLSEFKQHTLQLIKNKSNQIVLCAKPTRFDTQP